MVIPLIQAFVADDTGEVTLLHVIQPSAPHATEYRRMTMLPRQTASALYHEIIAQDMHEAFGMNIHVTTEVIVAEDIVATLLAHILSGCTDRQKLSQPWDLVCIGVIGARTQEPTAHQSVIQPILHTTTVPMLIQCSRLESPQSTAEGQTTHSESQVTDIDLGALVRATEPLDIPPSELVNAGD